MSHEHQLNEFLRLAAPNRYGHIGDLEPVNHTSVCVAREVLENSSSPRPCDCDHFAVDFEPPIARVMYHIRKSAHKPKPDVSEVASRVLKALEIVEALTVANLINDQSKPLGEARRLLSGAYEELRRL